MLEFAIIMITGLGLPAKRNDVEIVLFKSSTSPFVCTSEGYASSRLKISCLFIFFHRNYKWN